MRERRDAAGQREQLIVEAEQPPVLALLREYADEEGGAADQEVLERSDGAVDAGVPVESGSEGAAPEERFERMAIPGTFPTRFRRVTVP